MGSEQLDCHRPIQFRVESLQHDAHATAADFTFHFVRSKTTQHFGMSRRFQKCLNIDRDFDGSRLQLSINKRLTGWQFRRGTDLRIAEDPLSVVPDFRLSGQIVQSLLTTTALAEMIYD